jgi:hypothetical protein
LDTAVTLSNCKRADDNETPIGKFLQFCSLIVRTMNEPFLNGLKTVATVYPLRLWEIGGVDNWGKSYQSQRKTLCQPCPSIAHHHCPSANTETPLTDWCHLTITVFTERPTVIAGDNFRWFICRDLYEKRSDRFPVGQGFCFCGPGVVCRSRDSF